MGKTRSEPATASATPVWNGGEGSLWAHYGFENGPSGLRRRRLLVYLPPGYSEARRYPVLYLLDGQNVFDQPNARGGGWRINLAMDRLLADRVIKPALIVAVCHSDQRLREYCGWSEDEAYEHRLGDIHADYLVETVKPFIDCNYPTRPGRAHTAIAGASAGGVASLYAALKHPKVFSKVGCMSAGRHFFKELLEKFPRPPTNLSVFLSCGTEGMDTEFLSLNRSFRQALVRRGLTTELRVGRDEAHDERAWSRMVYALLRFILAKRTPSRT